MAQNSSTLVDFRQCFKHETLNSCWLIILLNINKHINKHIKGPCMGKRIISLGTEVTDHNVQWELSYSSYISSKIWQGDQDVVELK